MNVVTYKGNLLPNPDTSGAIVSLVSKGAQDIHFSTRINDKENGNRFKHIFGKAFKTAQWKDIPDDDYSSTVISCRALSSSPEWNLRHSTHMKFIVERGLDLYHTPVFRIILPSLQDGNSWKNNILDLLVRTAKISIGGQYIDQIDGQVNKALCESQKLWPVFYNRYFNETLEFQKERSRNEWLVTIPLMLGCMTHYKTSFIPIVALMHHECHVEIELESLKELTREPVKTISENDRKIECCLKFDGVALGISALKFVATGEKPLSFEHKKGKSEQVSEVPELSKDVHEKKKAKKSGVGLSEEIAAPSAAAGSGKVEQKNKEIRTDTVICGKPEEKREKNWLDNLDNII